MGYYQEKDLIDSNKSGILAQVEPITLNATKDSVAYTFKSALFSKGALNNLLATEGCEGIRFYTVLHQEEGSSDKHLTLLAVAEDAQADDMVGTTSYVSEKHCPPDCKP